MKIMSEKKTIDKQVGKVVNKASGKAEMFNGGLAKAGAHDMKPGDDDVLLAIFHQNEGMPNEDLVSLVKGFAGMPDDEIFLKMRKDAERSKASMKRSPHQKSAPADTARDVSKSMNKAGNVSDNIALDMAYAHTPAQQKRGGKRKKG
jgi:hypothetical protein